MVDPTNVFNYTPLATNTKVAVNTTNDTTTTNKALCTTKKAKMRYSLIIASALAGLQGQPYLSSIIAFFSVSDII